MPRKKSLQDSASCNAIPRRSRFWDRGVQDRGSSGNVLSCGQIWNMRDVAIQDRDLLAGVCASVYTCADPEEQGVLQAWREMPWQHGMRVGRECPSVAWGHKTGREKGCGVHYGRGTRGKFASHLLVPPLVE